MCVRYQKARSARERCLNTKIKFFETSLINLLFRSSAIVTSQLRWKILEQDVKHHLINQFFNNLTRTPTFLDALRLSYSNEEKEQKAVIDLCILVHSIFKILLMYKIWASSRTLTAHVSDYIAQGIVFIFQRIHLSVH